ncbi:(3S,6E)-nerolidol synthase 1, chloroplastic-like isoform X2 [Tasmannia lanceolata]|uniref:(3S,6E)-nerolidol synthase 1, chloroplastic-like isoform X2 n=1 Tax=Tasmannia lanceolata TaxID=3420 RepID=UPI00406321E8
MGTLGFLLAYQRAGQSVYLGLSKDVCNLLPNLNVSELIKAFAVKTNDMMLVIFLSSLIRSVIALHNWINNRDGLRIKQMEKVKEVRLMLCEAGNTLEGMIMIDSLQRLGINYHFQEEIEAILDFHHRSLDVSTGFTHRSLYEVALCFRLLRQHGHYVSADVFKNFKDEEGTFGQYVGKDIRGMMGLYEASHLRIDDEDILDEAYDFTSKHLKASLTVMEPDLRT